MSWLNDWHNNDIHPKISPKWLHQQVMCSSHACRYNCCKTYGAFIATQQEQQFLNRKYPKANVQPINPFINKLCPFLNPNNTGCIFQDDDKAMCCKTFPMAIVKNVLVVAHWAILHCPTPNKYTLSHTTTTPITQQTEYHYTAKPYYQNHFNILPSITTTVPIQNLPQLFNSVKKVSYAIPHQNFTTNVLKPFTQHHNHFYH